VDLKGKVCDSHRSRAAGIGHAIAGTLWGGGARALCVNYLGYEDDAKALAQAPAESDRVLKADVSKAGRGAVDGRRDLPKRLGQVELARQQRVHREANAIPGHRRGDPWDLMLRRGSQRSGFCALRRAGRLMRDSGRGGSIVNISSISTKTWRSPASPLTVRPKGGLRMVMRNAALELAQ